MRTNRWRQLASVSLVAMAALLVMGIFSGFRALFGIEYGTISTLLDVATIVIGVLVIIGIEVEVREKAEAEKEESHTESVVESEEEKEPVLIPGDDGEVWIINEDGMTAL